LSSAPYELTREAGVELPLCWTRQRRNSAAFELRLLHGRGAVQDPASASAAWVSRCTANKQSFLENQPLARALQSGSATELIVIQVLTFHRYADSGEHRSDGLICKFTRVLTPTDVPIHEKTTPVHCAARRFPADLTPWRLKPTRACCTAGETDRATAMMANCCVPGLFAGAVAVQVEKVGRGHDVKKIPGRRGWLQLYTQHRLPKREIEYLSTTPSRRWSYAAQNFGWVSTVFGGHAERLHAGDASC
jgi:hypothetical protein